MKRLATLVLGLAIASAGAGAATGIQNDRDINAGLLTIAVADKIRRECSSIQGRFFRAQGLANDLRSLAASRGYSRAEVDAYINDDREKAKMRERRNAYFEARGASNLDPESLCVLGRAEIDRNSRIGQLLKAK